MSNPSNGTTSTTRTKSYRRTRPLPRHLIDLCRIDLEEHLWKSAFALLEATLTSGTGTVLAAHIPDPEYLALAATLVIHPGVTTRTLDADKHVASDSALRYLHHVNRLVGPRNAALNEAFRFEDGSRSSLRDRRARERRSDLLRTAESPADYNSVRDSFAQRESIWRNAEDFWGVLGWAFNCSIVYPARWARWRLWISFMIDVLEDDLNLRAAESEVERMTALQGSLIASFLKDFGSARSSKRRVFRALFADGNSKSLAEFREVWRNETRPPPKPKTDEEMAGRKKLDFEAGEFADYLDSGSDDAPQSSRGGSRASSSRPSRPPSTTSTRKPRDEDDMSDEIVVSSGKNDRRTNHDSDDNEIMYEESDEEDDHDNQYIHVDGLALANGASFAHLSVQAFGGIESIRLRQRLLAILAQFCTLCPSVFTDIEDMFELACEFIRPLPLPLFQQFTCPAKQFLSLGDKTSLDRLLLRTLLESAASKYHSQQIDGQAFVERMAPFTATTTVCIDNAKVSLVVEDLLRMLWDESRVTYSKELQTAIEEGIRQRQDKANWDGRRKSNVRMQEEEDAARTLAASAARLRLCLDMIREEHG